MKCFTVLWLSILITGGIDLIRVISGMINVMDNAGGWVLKFLVIFVGLLILAVFPWLVIPAVLILVGCFIYSVVNGVDIPEGLITVLVGIVIIFLALVFFAIFPRLTIPLLIIAVLYNIIKWHL